MSYRSYPEQCPNVVTHNYSEKKRRKIAHRKLHVFYAHLPRNYNQNRYANAENANIVVN